MWLTNYITQNSINFPNASKGTVKSAGENTLSVSSACEHKQLRLCAPYGISSVPPIGECVVVLSLDDEYIGLGAVEKNSGLEPGEIMLYSKGGASIVLKNSGKVLINGKEY